jgi:hypothetical protein
MIFFLLYKQFNNIHKATQRFAEEHDKDKNIWMIKVFRNFLETLDQQILTRRSQTEGDNKSPTFFSDGTKA